MTSRGLHPNTRPSAVARPTVSIFSNAQGVAFNGNPTFHVNDSASVSTEAEGMNLLRRRVAAGAMHNSGERFDRPKCHPGTRIALQDDVSRWVDKSPRGQLVTWLFGPAGAGKSAIAQTISQKLHAEGKLTASFFFSRKEGASKGRGDELALVATLAYQLSLSAPATKPFIARVVYENPLIFDLSLDDQVQMLIVHPLTAVLQDNLEYDYPRVIVVDGLDECRKENSAQSYVVSALINGLSSIPQQSQKLFITSRPEHNIVAAFRSFKPELVRKMELNDEWKPDDDIWTFLQAGFAEICSSHPYFEDNPLDGMWPSRADIYSLVSRSSGQFIYASVVLKYIRSDDYYNPTARLEVILQLKNSEDQPYAELDALYKYIFSQIRGVENVLTVLSLERMLVASGYSALIDLALFLSYFTDARPEAIKFWLRPLASLLVWESQSRNAQIRYLHASLPDFLADESRSNTFCIYSLPIATKVVQRALDLLQDKDMFPKNINHTLPLLTILVHYSERLSLRVHILSLLTDFNFVDSILSQICLDSLSYACLGQVMALLGSYLSWILTESENNPAKAPVNSISQISAWITKQLMCNRNDQKGSPEQVDIWPFLMASAKYGELVIFEADLQYLIFKDTAAALEIYGPATVVHPVGVSNQAVVFYQLMTRIPQWLHNSTLLGQCAITEERYRAAFLRVSNYILQLPKNHLVATLNTDLKQATDSVFVAWKTFCHSMDDLPLSMELYFLVLYIASVVVIHVHDDPSYMRTTIGRSVKHYLQLMRRKFPFLNHPASPEYIKAQADAEATWIETRKDLHDPIPSIQVEQLPDLDFILDVPTSNRTSSHST